MIVGRKYFIVGVAMALAAAACSGGSGGDAPAPVSKSPFPAKCVAVPAGDVAWTYEDCSVHANGEAVFMDIDFEGLVPAATKVGYMAEPIGLRSVERGHLTFKYTNLDWTDLPWPTNDIVIMAFFAQDDAFAHTANFHMLGNRFAEDGRIETRMVTQRDDGVCIPERIKFCEKKDADYDKPKYDRAKTYRYDFTWDTSAPSLFNGQTTDIKDGVVKCLIYDATDPKKEVLIQSYMVPTSGPYLHFDTFFVGGNIGGKFNMKNNPIKMTELRMTFFK